MAISLQAKNSDLTAGQKYSFLNSNIASGVSAIVVVNSDGYEADNYILLGEWGNETSEIVKISTVTAGTHTLNLATATKFSHSESTKITIIPYNQTKFFQTAAATFDAVENPLDTIDVQPDSLFTIYGDSVNTTGFGWFKFYNSNNGKTSTQSNAIPYSGFGVSKVKTILDSFYSLLNSKERKLIDDKDALNYMSEGLSIIVTELNLSNDEYNVAGVEDISVVSGTSEYDLPSDFEKVVSLYNGEDKVTISFVPLDEVSDWDSESSNTMKYYLRGEYIGLSPEPGEAETLKLRYKKKSSIIDSYFDDITLPGNSHYILLNWLMFRSSQKLGSGKGQQYYKLFHNDIQKMKVAFHKRDNNNDSWSIDKSANI